MTHQPQPSAFATNNDPSFAQLRNDWLNAFARLELEVRRCIQQVTGEPYERGTALGQCLKSLAGSKASASCSKALIAKLPELCAACRKVLHLRATIVHSAMVEGRRDNQPVALFQNLEDALAGTRTYTVLNAVDFDRTRKELLSLQQRFAEYTRASAPPQPKPAEAAGP
jgi:hypothetical protein